MQGIWQRHTNRLNEAESMTHYRRRQKAESVTEPLRQTTSAVLGIGGAVIGAGIGL
jgi:hypothetical protein